MNLKKLFEDFYNANTETELDDVIQKMENAPGVSWTPYGENESFFGVIENQQASAVPALVEKITNSIDAILMRRCLEEGINPKGPDAPKSVDEAIRIFFENSENWDLSHNLLKQAESIQIIASGPRKDTSLVIYDDGEGQHPLDFGSTFLSLLRGNKNDVPFVQGKYNMGGSGAVVFCGKKRYQLIASKRFDNDGEFGFTILRKHPLSTEEEKTRKNTWYEYLLIDGNIPSFPIDTLDLGLRNRHFTTGTVIKLYSYELPPGSRSVISRELNNSINEFLFEPALPLYTIDTNERFPNDVNPERHLYGLKRRLEKDDSKYIREFFSESHSASDLGSLKISVYVFNSRIDGKSAKDTKDSVRREFFKNNMSVMFSVNGQVHGNYTSEFITRTLKFNLLKDYLLIHVDCTDLKPSFRNELFMASRDRLKNGEEGNKLRNAVAEILSKGRLKEIYKEWKDTFTAQSDNAEDLLKDFTKQMPMNSELMKLLGDTFTLDIRDKKKERKETNQSDGKKKDRKKEEKSFDPQRYPSVFSVNLNEKDADSIPLTSIPLGGGKVLSFSTDVEDQYFDRVEDPGELQLTVLSRTRNDTKGGTASGDPKDLGELFNVSISSPSKGKIRVNMSPNDKVSVDDSIEIKASLTSPNGDLDQIFMVRISDKQQQPKLETEPKKSEDNIGLPKLQKVFKSPGEEVTSWEDVGSSGIDMDHSTVMYPFVDGDKLDTIFVNMDSSVLKKYKSSLRSEQQWTAADKRYISAVYFHTLFLYSISKNRRYQITKEKADDMNSTDGVELSDYLMDIFDSNYTEFLLNFEMSTLMETLAD